MQAHPSMCTRPFYHTGYKNVKDFSIKMKFLGVEDNSAEHECVF